MKAANKRLKFLSVAWIQGLRLNPRNSAGFRLRRSGRYALGASLVPRYPESDPFGAKSLECKVHKSYLVSTPLFNFVDRLNAGVLTSYPGIAIRLPHVSRNRELIAADGTLAKGYHLSWQHYPDDLKSICELALNELEAETQRLIKLLMWYFNTSHVHDPVQHVALYCKTGGKNYHAIKLSGGTQGVWQNDIVWSGVNSAGFNSVWKSKSEESLAHELFREAGSLLESAPRSALLMLASALEAGVKKYVSERAPVTEWLLSETQSPPIPKMLRQFLPTLTPATPANLSNWTDLRPIFKRLTKLTEVRNQLTHRGTWDIPDSDLIEFKEDVSDILYMLDYLNGTEWAINNIRKETCQALKWPKPISTQTQLRAKVTISAE